MKYAGISGLLAWQDIRQAYRRSAIGPFWITIGMAVQIITMGLVFSLIFKTETREYIPFLAASILIWGFVSTTLLEGCSSLITAESLIKQLNLPTGVYVLRTLFKNLFTFAHNIVLIPIVFLVFMKPISLESLLLIPGIFLVTVNLGWLTLLLGMISARYRDFPPIINSLITIGFFITPVMWSPDLVGDNELAHLLLGLNPLYHLLQVLRLPLLGQIPTLANWSITLAMCFVGWTLAGLFYKKFRSQIAYWV